MKLQQKTRVILQKYGRVTKNKGKNKPKNKQHNFLKNDANGLKKLHGLVYLI